MREKKVKSFSTEIFKSLSPEGRPRHPSRVTLLTWKVKPEFEFRRSLKRVNFFMFCFVTRIHKELKRHPVRMLRNDIFDMSERGGGSKSPLGLDLTLVKSKHCRRS